MEIAARNGYFRKAVVDFGFFKSYLGRSFDDMESLTDLAPNWSTEGPFVETRRAVDWVSKHKDESFFLFLHISPTHAPYRSPGIGTSGSPATRPSAPDRRTEKTSIVVRVSPVPDGDRIPDDEIARFSQSARYAEEGGIEEALVALIRDLYRLEVRVADEAVGMLAGELERLGIFDTTVLSVSSDHGEELWDHGSFGHGAGAMYNEVIRTPWILTCPERIPAGTVVTECVSQTNVLRRSSISRVSMSASRLRREREAARLERFRERRRGGRSGSGFLRHIPLDQRRAGAVQIDRAEPAHAFPRPQRKAASRAPSREAPVDGARPGGGYAIRSSIGSRGAEQRGDPRDGHGEGAASGGRPVLQRSALRMLGASDLSAAEEEQVRKELDRLGYL